MGLKDFFRRSESLVGIDIGAGSIKLVELDLSEEKPRLVNVGLMPVVDEIFDANELSKREEVADLIMALVEENSVKDRRVVVAMPGPSVFTKRVKLPIVPVAELAETVMLEAGNFIPHDINAVKLDYHVIGESGKNQIDVLVVAVKEEIIGSYIECLSIAGLEAAVVDVDYFAVQNMFELGYPELVDKTVALVNMGSRYSGINICRDGQSLFTGDIPVGGKIFTESLAEGLNISHQDAENLKKSLDNNHPQYDTIREILDRNVEYVAMELNRNLSFFWSASGSEDSIDKIMVAGGGSLIPGLLEELSEKTGVPCERLEPLRGIEVGSGFDEAFLKEVSPFLCVAVGMGIRQPSDRELPEFLEGA